MVKSTHTASLPPTHTHTNTGVTTDTQSEFPSIKNECFSIYILKAAHPPLSGWQRLVVLGCSNIDASQDHHQRCLQPPLEGLVAVSLVAEFSKFSSSSIFISFSMPGTTDLLAQESLTFGVVYWCASSFTNTTATRSSQG